MKNNFKLIAHRLAYAMTNHPENSLSNLENIFNNEDFLNICDGFEFDICFTKDLIPVVIHDKNIDGASDGIGFIKKLTYQEILNFNFGFRKSSYTSELKWEENNIFKLHKLEDFLDFFLLNKDKLTNKIIKIETKEILSKNKITILNNLLQKYKELNNNIVHLSFFPMNLKKLRKLQIKNNDLLTRSDFLVDFRILVNLFGFRPYLDTISFGVKNNSSLSSKIKLSKRAMKTFKIEKLLITHRNALSKKIALKALKKYNQLNIYTINNDQDINELIKILGIDFINEYSGHICITTDNPLFFKS